ncbi:MAG TPA: Uma2 family endonuclease [Leptolyngbyaceae cyanobacterium]
MVTTLTPAEQRVLLKNISWQLFESLLQEMGEQRSTRLAYHKGKLELMTPLWEHENPNRKIEAMVIALVDELNLNIEMGGSVTLKRPEKAAGKEPDSCYYIQNETRVRGKKDIDLTQDPPPDLALEIDITSSSLNQLNIYADLGVPEVWRYNGRTLKIYQLQNNEYVESNFSPTFPLLPATKVEEFLEQCQNLGVTAAVRQFREWIKNQLQNRETERSQG